MVSIGIAPKVYIVGGRTLTHPLDENSYLVLSNPPILVDIGTGLGIHNLLRNLLELGIAPHKIGYLVITHAHVWNAGGCHIFKEISHCSTIAHYFDSLILKQPRKELMDSEDQEPMPCSITIEIRESKRRLDVEELGVEILHTPGHTKGSISVVIESSTMRVALVGGLLGPLSKKWNSSLEMWYESLRKILNCDVDILCSGTQCIHGRSKIRKIIENVMSRGAIWV